MATTTEIGNQFRDQVAQLLRLSGYSVQVEVQIGHKKVDIFCEERTLGKSRRYGVEAKNYSKGLTKTELVEIYSDYEALLDSNQIDEVLVIAPIALTAPAATTYVQTKKNLSHQTLLELQESVMGFERYLRNLIHTHDAERVEQYYLSPNYEVPDDSDAPKKEEERETGPLEPLIENWLSGGAAEPIALLAGYGMGKTTFSSHIAYVLAKRALSGEPVRIPILVRLGKFVYEQSLEGLLATTLTAASPVDRFNFPLFEELNRSGRFLVILDGFDEMKHAMTAGEFRSNFAQLNRLVSGNSRVLLLGRPSVFQSDMEQGVVLRGVKLIDDKLIQTPVGAPQYKLLTIKPFTGEAALEFSHRYMRALLRTNGDSESEAFITRRVTEIRDGGYDDLIRRPVQAKMLTELAADASVRLERFSRYGLYKHFIDHIIDREMEKPGRQAIAGAIRRTFICDLAWWLWRTGRNSGCRLDEVPASLIASAQAAAPDRYPEGIRRELIAGSLLEEKQHGIFYIPHRSYTEFLVAEYLAAARIDHAFVAENYRVITPPVLRFLDEGSHTDPLLNMFGVLEEVRGRLSLAFLQALLSSGTIAGKLSSVPANKVSPWHVFCAVMEPGVLRVGDPIGSGGAGERSRKRVLELLNRRPNEISNVVAAILALALIAIRVPQVWREVLVTDILTLIAKVTPQSALSWNDMNSDDRRVVRKMIIQTNGPGGIPLQMLVNSFQRDREAGTQLSVRLIGKNLLDEVRSHLFKMYSIDELYDGEPLAEDLGALDIRIPLNNLEKRVSKEMEQRIRSYFTTQPHVTFVETRPDRSRKYPEQPRRARETT